jgi:hypothetical protein
MRDKPTWRIPAGVLGLFAALIIYGLLIAGYISPLIDLWPNLAQMAVYLLLGVIWLLPLRRFLIWMETGSWSPPEG